MSSFRRGESVHLSRKRRGRKTMDNTRRSQGRRTKKAAGGSRAALLKAQGGALEAGFLVPQVIEGLLKVSCCGWGGI